MFFCELCVSQIDTLEVFQSFYVKDHPFDSSLSLSSQDEIMSFESDKQAVYLQVYRPVYFQLVDVLLHKAQFPSDQEYASWSSDEKEQFRIYRCVCLLLCLRICMHGSVSVYCTSPFVPLLLCASVSVMV